MSHQMMINKCHSCDIRVGCDVKEYPCYIYVKQERKKIEKVEP